jgi:hypothetical protein
MDLAPAFLKFKKLHGEAPNVRARPMVSHVPFSGDARTALTET